MATEASTSSGLSVETESMTAVHWFGVVLALVTAAVHLVLGVRVPSGLGISFLLAGLGFLGAIVLLLVGYRRRLLYLVGVPFTGAQLAIWYALNVLPEGPLAVGAVGTFGAVDKIAQVLLIVVLIYLFRAE
ncbi:MAG: hypothetical protein A07HB70_01910 [uncultured archaeon A07HB70]|nr:MAG: hypothetical protein A07HB70_01910 [uncultured archaeon A07HB70]